jgi:hypothetical protein
VLDTFADCDSTAAPVACGNYTSSPFETLDGASVFKFVTNDGSGLASDIFVYDVFTVPGAVTQGSTLTINFNASGSEVDFGDFACANGAGGPVSADNKAMTGPCTIGNISALSAFLSETQTADSAKFTFSGSGLPASWAFYVTDGDLASLSFTAGSGSTSTPEPASASLLLVGAVALGLVALKARR